MVTSFLSADIVSYGQLISKFAALLLNRIREKSHFLPSLVISIFQWVHIDNRCFSLYSTLNVKALILPLLLLCLSDVTGVEITEKEWVILYSAPRTDNQVKAPRRKEVNLKREWSQLNCPVVIALNWDDYVKRRRRLNCPNIVHFPFLDERRARNEWSVKVSGFPKGLQTSWNQH